MSLATSLAAGGLRPASSLPTIKCSNCGDEIEISAMGDHLCSRAPPSPRSQPASLSNPFTLRQLNATSSKPAQPSPLQFDNPPQSRPRAPTAGSMSSMRMQRSNLPRINPDAANGPFLSPNPGPHSPISPAVSSRSGSSTGARGYPPPQRSMTGPMPRLWDPRPPSPELSANLDCAFPPFPFGDPPASRPGSSNGRNTPSERGSSRAGSRQDGRTPEPSSAEPRSPTTSNAGENVVNRMHTLKSGPFDPRRPSRDTPAQQDTRPLDRRRPSMPNLRIAEEPPPLPPVPSTTIPTPIEPPSEYAAPPAISDGFDFGTEITGDSKLPPPRPARPRESLDLHLVKSLSNESENTMVSDFPLPPQPLQIGRTQTPSPLKENNDDIETLPTLEKVTSAPALREDLKRPSMPEPSQSEPIRTFPARSTSRVAARIDMRMDDAPPVPKPVQLQRSDSRHRPTDSNSSTASSNRSLENSTSSIGASPVTSAASSIDTYSPLSVDVGTFGADRGMRPADLKIRAHDNPGMRAEMPSRMKSPPRNFARPVPPPAVTEPPKMPELELDSPTLPAGNWPLDSPIDPGLKDGILGGAAPEQSLTPRGPPRESVGPSKSGFHLSPEDLLEDEFDPYKPPTPRFPPTNMQLPPPPPPQEPIPQLLQPHTRARSRSTNQPPTRPFSPPTFDPRSPTPQLSRAQTFDPSPAPRPLQPPPIPRSTQPSPAFSRRATTTTKPKCRGCNLTIEGKSVKAADGRLTGRWHKQCFTCKTCEQPFRSADFYVIDNNPYCEQHYHEKNGSTCAGCRRGIEGQYLETSSMGPQGRVERKFHPRCFTCVNCRMVLSEDYFEISGRVFCERHALAEMRALPRAGGGPVGGRPGLMPHGASGLSGLKAERRTTKLMTMV